VLNRLKEFLKDDRGQATTEYILILAVVVMVAIKFKSTYSKQLDSIMQSTFHDIDSGLQNGPSD
jgi:Flp pilus assembly pilin Flp